MARNDYADAFGVIDDDGLNVRTVSDTRQAAIVNWLVTKANIMVRTYHGEDEINTMWDAHRGEAIVQPVRIYARPL